MHYIQTLRRVIFTISGVCLSNITQMPLSPVPLGPGNQGLAVNQYFSPFFLQNDFVLWPGNPDIAAKYREKVYYFKSSDNRSKFVEKPDEYLPKDRPLTPPPPRILILGAQGSGKTTHGRWLAKKLGIFHISFRERLQVCDLQGCTVKSLNSPTTI